MCGWLACRSKAVSVKSGWQGRMADKVPKADRNSQAQSITDGSKHAGKKGCLIRIQKQERAVRAMVAVCTFQETVQHKLARVSRRENNPDQIHKQQQKAL